MRFEERNLKPHGEPISASDLRTGSVYFSVNFVDEEMTAPVMEPVVFIGRNLKPDDSGEVYFQDFDSYRRGVRYGSANEEDSGVIQSGSEKSIGHIHEFEQALEVLMRCSLRRRNLTAK